MMEKGMSKPGEVLPRRAVDPAHRSQKVVQAYLEYLNDLCVRAQKQGLEVVTLLEIGSGSGDLLLAVYQREVDAQASGTPLVVKVFVKLVCVLVMGKILCF